MSMPTGSFRNMFLSIIIAALLAGTTLIVSSFLYAPSMGLDERPKSDAALFLLSLAKWSSAQWIPFRSFSQSIEKQSWDDVENLYAADLNIKSATTNKKNNSRSNILEIQTCNVQDHKNGKELLDYLETTYGKNWKRRPLLLKNIWSTPSSSRLSLVGLLKENLKIPYFTDSSRPGALTPDAIAPIQDIVANITKGAPHKIGTQLFIAKHPELVKEVAPTDIVTSLFGNHFLPESVASGPVFGLFPPLTTVPLFVAATAKAKQSASTTTGTCNLGPVTDSDTGENTENDDNSKDGCDTATGDSKQHKEIDSSHDDDNTPFTGLHCEPIGNVAVQLEGQKQWTLVDPEYSFRLRPSIAADGRAYFYAGSSLTQHQQQHSGDDKYSDNNDIPRYYATTDAGDAIWIPTWTWHRVDYYSYSSSSVVIQDDSDEIHSNSKNQDVAIGASLFHFRPADFFMNNPLFALLILPNLVKEIVGWKTQ